MVDMHSTQAASPTPDAVLKAMSASLGVPFIRLTNRRIDPAALQRIPEDIARSHHMIAYEEAKLGSGKKILRLAVSDPKNLEQEAPQVITDLHTREGMLIEVALTPASDLEQALQGYASAKSPSAERGKKQPANNDNRLAEANKPKATEPASQTVDLKNREISQDALERIPRETAEKYRVIVFDTKNNGQTIHVAAENPDNPQVTELLSFIRDRNHLDMQLFKTDADSISAALKSYSQKSVEHNQKKPVVSVRPPVKVAEAPIVQSKKEEKKPAFNPELFTAAKEAEADRIKPATTPQVKFAELQSPDLRVPTGGEATQPLIPVGGDVERDLKALIGKDITTVEELEEIIRSGFIPKIVGAVVYLAAQLGASDIHMQAGKEDLQLRYRVDGILRDILRMPVALQAPIVSRVKILAKMKIDEQRIPQDGRFDVLVNDREIDLRISTLPTVRGEKLVMRLLDKSVGLLKFADLGLIGTSYDRMEKQIHKPYGVILSTGPTGSGKSTTLYTILQEITSPTINVVTLEDPVEYEMDGINQVQIKPKIGFGFAEGLRSILRQDPNIIMVGEIRDAETATLMTHAALTGHLVLSTLHTNDAAGALPRLINMGVEPFLITSAMNAVVAQRLVRKLCESCRDPWTPPEDVKQTAVQKLSEGNLPELMEIVQGAMQFYKAKGCDKCTDGYKGRMGIYEVLIMSDAIEALAVKKAPAAEIAKQAIIEGMITMEQDGLRKAATGLTTLDEVLRVTSVE